MESATAVAHPNIALIKYWGDRDVDLHIPANGSISINLADLNTRTTAAFSTDLPGDDILIDNQPAMESTRSRVSQFLDRFRKLYRVNGYFQIESANNFPSSAGIASSASAFAALSLAASAAYGLNLNEAELSRLARLGSGSACRSIPAGFVEWQTGTDHESSFAYSIAPPSHWDLVDCITIVDDRAKSVSSLQGHIMAATSPLQTARIKHTESRLFDCRQAIAQRDFDLLARVVELDSNMMHAVMMTSNPPLLFWLPATVAVMQFVIDGRKKGLPVCYTIDAGANVHVLCEESYASTVIARLKEIPRVLRVIEAKPGGAAILNTDY